MGRGMFPIQAAVSLIGVDRRRGHRWPARVERSCLDALGGGVRSADWPLAGAEASSKVSLSPTFPWSGLWSGIHLQSRLQRHRCRLNTVEPPTQRRPLPDRASQTMILRNCRPHLKPLMASAMPCAGTRAAGTGGAMRHPRTGPAMPSRWSTGAALGQCLVALCLAGCAGLGPRTMSYQQADYAAALAEAGKRQTLMNIVKLRYGDVPAFVTVNQILAGYSLQGTFSVGTDLLTGGSFRLSDDANLGIGGTFTNSPTITYAPVTGADFARTFLAPLQPADLFGLMLSSVPPELVLGLGLHSFGALQQRAGDGSGTAPARSAIHRGADAAARAAARRAAADPAGGPGAGPDRHAQDRRRRRGRRSGAPPSPAPGTSGRSRHLRDRLFAGRGGTGPDPDPYPLADGSDDPARRGHRRARGRPARGAHGARGRRDRSEEPAAARLMSATGCSSRAMPSSPPPMTATGSGSTMRLRDQAHVQFRHAAPVPEREQPARPAAGDHDPGRGKAHTSGSMTWSR